MEFDMIENAKKKYVGRKYTWQAREIIVVNCFSCSEGDFFEYYFTDDADRCIRKISMFDAKFMQILT